FFSPSDAQTSPRILAVFKETRKAMLPDVVQRTYANAKASFEKKDAKALVQFEQLLQLLDDPDLRTMPQLEDLRTVVSGFRDLSKAMANAAAVVPAAPAIPALQPVVAAGAASPGSSVVTTIIPAVEKPSDVVPGFTPPIVISQTIPQWVPPGSVDR